MNIVESPQRIILDSTTFLEEKYAVALEHLLKNPTVDESIGGIKHSDRHPAVVTRVSELFRNEREPLPALIDDSSSGGYNDMIDEIESVLRIYGFRKAVFTLGRNIMEDSVRFVSNAVNRGKEGSRRNKFLLSTFLPENLPLGNSLLVTQNPEEYTYLVHKQAEELQKSDVVGVYGAASIVVPGFKLMLGSGVSFSGEPYESSGVKKNSVDITTALENCHNILIGRMLLTGVFENDSQDFINGKVVDNFERARGIVESVQ